MKEMFVLGEEIGPMRAAVDIALARIAGERVLERIWQRDHSVWPSASEQQGDRLGWLDMAARMKDELGALRALTREAVASGYRRAIFVGEGALSTTAELLRDTFVVAEKHLELDVLDTVDESTISQWTESIDYERTLWIIAATAGRSIETTSLLKYFYGHVSTQLGEARAGEHFVAIAEPEASLAKLARDWDFRQVVFSEPITSRAYSGLSPYGLVPAALLGLDLEGWLDRARDMAARCGPEVAIENNPGARLGVIMGELARAGRDKLTLLMGKQAMVRSFGAWVEQLVALSTGKEGRGILPVVDEPIAPPHSYGPDRLFICLSCEGEDQLGDELEVLTMNGHPVIRIQLCDPYDLGGQLFLWQLATVVAAHQLQVDPFDECSVESAERATFEIVETFKAKGELPQMAPTLSDGLLTIQGNGGVKAATPLETYRSFLSRTRPPEYVAIQAFLRPTDVTTELLMQLRTQLRDELGVAVTFGYGPRFLHTTGQLHRGDAGHGQFVQIVADERRAEGELPIPDEMGFTQGVVSFRVLEAALAMGNVRSLEEAGRKVLVVHLGADVSGGLNMLIHAFDAHRSSAIPPVI